MKGLAQLVGAGCTMLWSVTAARCQDDAREPPRAAIWPMPPIADLVEEHSTPAYDDSIAEDLIHSGWQIYPQLYIRYLAPSAAPLATLTFQDSLDLMARQHRTRLGVRLAPIWTADLAALDLEASLGNREDLMRQVHGVQDVTACAKLMLPEALHRWYLKVQATADTESSTQQEVAVGVVWPLGNVSHLDFNVGVAQRQMRSRPRQHIGRSSVSSAVQWRWSERLGMGIRLSYDPLLRDVNASMSLNVQSPLKPP